MNAAFIPKVLFSKIDESVNFVFPNGLEARFVHRPDTDYFIVYLSSHRGCDQACRFCHLTQTKQVDMTPATTSEYMMQTDSVMKHYLNLLLNEKIDYLKKVNFNWMARGEPLLNPDIRSNWGYIAAGCHHEAFKVGINSINLNISTIMPSIEEPLRCFYNKEFPNHLPRIYYSLYSVDPQFRKRWLPKAMEPQKALAYLKEYQSKSADWSGNEAEVILHWAFIEGQNDSKEDVDRIIDLVEKSGVRTRFNLVRYNPYSPTQGRESSEEVIQERFEQFSSVMKVSGSKIVPRVGKDVFASCGMFINT